MNHAELLGIDLEQLKTESPDHVKQIKIRRKIQARSDHYWGQKIPEPTKWLSLAEVANRLFVHPETVRRWIKSGHIGHKRVKNRIVVDVQDIEDWLATRRAGHTSTH